MCARFLSQLLYLHINRVHEKIPGRTVLGQVHPVGAQNKTLISDTERYCFEVIGNYGKRCTCP